MVERTFGEVSGTYDVRFCAKTTPLPNVFHSAATLDEVPVACGDILDTDLSRAMMASSRLLQE